MVDEYQDTNALQAAIVRDLAGEHGNVLAVGDDAQSIYGFRGADFRNIMDFPTLFPGTRIIALEENYRSTQPILDVSNAIIDGARERHRKTLFTRRRTGPQPMLVRPRVSRSSRASSASASSSCAKRASPCRRSPCCFVPASMRSTWRSS